MAMRESHACSRGLPIPATDPAWIPSRPVRTRDDLMRHDAQHTVERPVTIRGDRRSHRQARHGNDSSGGRGRRHQIHSQRPEARHLDSRALRFRFAPPDLCTVIGDGSGASISTVEHLLSALAAFGIDNAIIEVDGPEAPIMDGSAAAFVDAVEEAGRSSFPRAGATSRCCGKCGSRTAPHSPNSLPM